VENQEVIDLDSEQEDSEVLSKRRKAFDIEGIGEFRGKPGTAVYELAGAASYWEKRAKQLERAIIEGKRNGWQSGFTAGLATALVIGTVAFALYRVFA
jgi:hypothetical protein